MQLTLYLKVKGNVFQATVWWGVCVCVSGGVIAIQCHLPCMQIHRPSYTVNPELELERHFNQVKVHRSQGVSKWRLYSA